MKEINESFYIRALIPTAYIYETGAPRRRGPCAVALLEPPRAGAASLPRQHFKWASRSSAAGSDP